MPTKPETVREWIRFAQEDLTSAHVLINADSNLLASVCFHCQQSAEKILKAFLTARDESFPKVHAMILLYDLCQRIDPEFSEIRDAGEWLTRFAVQARYPGGRPLTKAEAEKALRDAEQIMNFVSKRLIVGSQA